MNEMIKIIEVRGTLTKLEKITIRPRTTGPRALYWHLISEHSCPCHRLCLGVISGVDHENAFCWYSCFHCSSEDIAEISNR
jgi:hypothetical protein